MKLIALIIIAAILAALVFIRPMRTQGTNDFDGEPRLARLSWASSLRLLGCDQCAHRAAANARSA